MKDFDFGQIRFDADTLQVVSVTRRNENLRLPLTQGPVNFSVAKSDGKFSNRWGVYINRKGDAYVYNRDNRNAEKISLHASGKQHISVSKETAEKAGLKGRFGNQWYEPMFDTEAIPTLSLMFPPWGVGLEPTEIPKRFNKDELLIVGHREMLVVVAFFIMDSGRKLQGRISHIVLGQLPLKKGKVLHIIAWKEPQGNLIEQVRYALYRIPKISNLDNIDGEITMNLQGYRQPNSAYLVVVPVHRTSPETGQTTKSTSGRQRNTLGSPCTDPEQVCGRNAI